MLKAFRLVACTVLFSVACFTPMSMGSGRAMGVQHRPHGRPQKPRPGRHHRAFHLQRHAGRHDRRQDVYHASRRLGAVRADLGVEPFAAHGERRRGQRDQPLAENRPHRLLLPADDRELGYRGAFHRQGKGPGDILLLHHPPLPQRQWRQRIAGRRFAGGERVRLQHLRKQHALHRRTCSTKPECAIASSAIAPAIASRRLFSTASTTRSTATWPPSCSCGTTTRWPTSWI